MVCRWYGTDVAWRLPARAAHATGSWWAVVTKPKLTASLGGTEEVPGWQNLGAEGQQPRQAAVNRWGS